MKKVQVDLIMKYDNAWDDDSRDEDVEKMIKLSQLYAFSLLYISKIKVKIYANSFQNPAVNIHVS